MNDIATAIAVALAAALIIANVAVSVAVARSHLYGGWQKAAQIGLLWTVPAAGAIVVGVFLYSQRDNPQFDTRAFPEHGAVAMPEEARQLMRNKHDAD